MLSKCPSGGVLIVDKPSGMTSAAVVARVKRILGGIKVGHTGTLDPMASGVLPIVVGPATRIASYIVATTKGYSGLIELGVETDTLDREGSVVAENRDALHSVTQAAVLEAVAELRGDIAQVPPMYSALKRNGKRLHQLARAGLSVELEPRAVTVHRFDVTSFETPEVGFEIECSKGTYVRCLARDLGRALGVGATLTSLRRTHVGPFDLDAATPLDALDADRALEQLIPPSEALVSVPRVEVAAELVDKVANGLRLAADAVAEGLDKHVRFQLITDGRILAIAHVEEGRLRYERVFPRLEGKG